MRLHLVDGTFELFRAYYARPARLASRDRGAVALRSLARSLLALLGEPEVSHVAVAFDHEIESFRNELYASYKSGEGLDPELRAQFEPAEDLCRALGLVTWPMVEYEADDALASAAARYGALPEVEQIVLCSPDKDLAQCVVGDRIVGLDRIRARTLDETGVIDKFGVPPAAIPDWLALVGDSADGFPGIPRWGAKSAAAVLAVYGRLEDIPEDASRWSISPRGATTLARELAARREDAYLFRRLATLVTAVPLAESLDQLRWRGPQSTVAGEKLEPAISARAEQLARGKHSA